MVSYIRPGRIYLAMGSYCLYRDSRPLRKDRSSVSTSTDLASHDAGAVYFTEYLSVLFQLTYLDELYGECNGTARACVNSGYQALFSPITECLGTRQPPPPLPLNSIFILTLDAASPHFSTVVTPWDWTWASNLLFRSLRPSDTHDTNMYILDKSVEWVGGGDWDRKGRGKRGRVGGYNPQSYISACAYINIVHILQYHIYMFRAI